MREIDNKNINSLNFKGIQKASNDETVTTEANIAPQSEKEIKDLANMPAAFLGKSQIAKDSVDSDMQFFVNNSERVEKMNAYFDKYAQEYGYEAATQMLDELNTSKK